MQQSAARAMKIRTGECEYERNTVDIITTDEVHSSVHHRNLPLQINDPRMIGVSELTLW